jgi:hypothetical protein
MSCGAAFRVEEKRSNNDNHVTYPVHEKSEQIHRDSTGAATTQKVGELILVIVSLRSPSEDRLIDV